MTSNRLRCVLNGSLYPGCLSGPATATCCRQSEVTRRGRLRAGDEAYLLEEALRVAFEGWEQGQGGGGADVGEVAVGFLELQVDVDQVLFGADE